MYSDGVDAVDAVLSASGNDALPHSLVSREHDKSRSDYQGKILWLTGLSGSGKTTIARELENRLRQQNFRTVILDGDGMRRGLCADLGFSRDDRRENIRRVGEVARLFMQTGLIAISAFISPYAADRERLRCSIRKQDFIEIYLNCSLAECERRDPKGLYQKARAGEITGFTGIDDPFEPPESPDITINTEELTVNKSIDAILSYLKNEGRLLAGNSRQHDDSTITSKLQRGFP